MLTFPRPAEINGDLLAADLAAAGLTTAVYVTDDDLCLPDLDEDDRATAQPVVDAHPANATNEATRLGYELANETSIRDKAATALADNKAFLAITSPTNAQTLAQVKALTRQNSALIRLVLRRFDGTD